MTLLSFACYTRHSAVNGFLSWPSSISSFSRPSQGGIVALTRSSFLSRCKSVALNLVPFELDDTTQIGASARSSLNCEVDYMGMINFCLRSTDNGLSGPSTNKFLNEITNDAFRVLMMGYDPAVELTLLGLATWNEQISAMADSQIALTYLSWIEMLLLNGEVKDLAMMVSDPITSPYVKGYRRLLDLLTDAGCISADGLGRPKPENSNICLSLLDLSRSPGSASKTLELNSISNCVSKVRYIFLLILFHVERIIYTFTSFVHSYSRATSSRNTILCIAIHHITSQCAPNSKINVKIMDTA